MKVIMKSYPNSWNAYTLVEKFLPFLSEDNKDIAGDYLDSFFKKLKINKINDYFYNRANKNRIYVRVDNYDVWSADHTLAEIIVPVLKKLKEQKHGSPSIDNEDVPDHLRSTAAPPVDDYDTDENFHKRWDWVLDEMIWAFSSYIYEDDNKENEYDCKIKKGDDGFYDYDMEKKQAIDARVENGRRLFAKYFNALWD